MSKNQVKHGLCLIWAQVILSGILVGWVTRPLIGLAAFLGLSAVVNLINLIGASLVVAIRDRAR